ncbi:MAG: YHS domain-containing protein [Candidatus Brocadiia bacterium]
MRSLFLTLVLISVVTVAVAETPASTGQPKAVPNTLCPVMPQTPVSMAIFTDYLGTRIYFCSEECKQEFRNNPAKYLANVPAFAGSDLPVPSPASSSLSIGLVAIIGLTVLLVLAGVTLLVVARRKGDHE